MSDNRGVVGGFVASNEKNGKIEDCYCVMRFNGKKYTSGGFVGENQGNIDKSFCESVATGLEGGFSGNGATFTDSCYFIHNLDENNKKISKFWDKKYGLKADDIASKEDATRAGFDMEKTWKYTGKTPVLQFEDMNWICDEDEFTDGKKKFAIIKNEETLMKFAEGVNAGKTQYINAYVRLDANIDLGGKKWTPIGLSKKNAFKGVFDGNGYCIKNFVVDDKSLEYEGFFGFLEGEVYNLTVDCEIKGEGCFGAVAAVNEGSIGCCGAVVGLYGKGNKLNAGGLVGKNRGKIYKSYAAGKMKFLIIPVVQIAIILAFLLISGSTIYAVKVKMNNNGIFNNVKTDPNQEKIKDEPISTEKYVGKVHSISFGLNHKVYVDLAKNKCDIEFANPEGEFKLKLELKMKINGEEKVIATSGAVEPGYKLQELYLSEYACLNLKKGQYEAWVSMTPYGQNDNDKAMVETELPVELIVK